MKHHNLAWAAAAVWAAACVAVAVEATEGPPPNYRGQAQSHGHMKQHVHVRNHGHRHHVPQRSPPDTTQKKNDPKRMPKDTPGNSQLLQDNELFHDKEHLKEEMPEYMNLEKLEEMSDRELDFHYFRMHDFDNNLLLDGLELLAALGHVVGEEDNEEEVQDGEEGKKTKEENGEDSDDALKSLNEEEQQVVRDYRHQKWEESWKFYIELVDGVMEKNDLDKDGFINWREFLMGRNRKI